MAVAQARRIDVDDSGLTLVFAPNHRHLKDMVEQNRPWLENAAQQIAGRKVAVRTVLADAPASAQDAARPAAAAPEKKPSLRDQAMADSGVQAMLEVFPAEIRDVEEMEK